MLNHSCEKCLHGHYMHYLESQGYAAPACLLWQSIQGSHCSMSASEQAAPHIAACPATMDTLRVERSRLDIKRAFFDTRSGRCSLTHLCSGCSLRVVRIWLTPGLKPLRCRAGELAPNQASSCPAHLYAFLYNLRVLTLQLQGTEKSSCGGCCWTTCAEAICC